MIPVGGWIGDIQQSVISHLQLNKLLNKRMRIVRASKLTAFLSGLPLGAYLAFLLSAHIVEDSHQKVANFFFVGYFLSASVFFVIGLESIKRRLDMSHQDFFGYPIGFIKLSWELMVNNFFRMMLFASGVIVGVGLWKAGAII